MYVWMRFLHHFLHRLRHREAGAPPTRRRCPNCGEEIFAGPGETPRCPRCSGEVTRPGR
jgi:uncharacterized protein with PIN domain